METQTVNYNGKANVKLTIPDLTAKESPTWCPGCGDFTILSSIKNALVELNIPKEDILMVSGIGCGSKTPHFVNVYGFEGLHGRALPVATAAKLVNPDLTVIVITGDGDGYGIGGNHFLHSLRRNTNITHIIQNNEVYGLTKGQYSPTSKKGFVSPSSPSGALEEPMNPMALSIVQGATFVARGYAMDINHLKKIIVDGVQHKGYSVIDTFQPCTTYNKANSMLWYKEHIYKLEEEGHDPTNKQKALEKAMENLETHPKVPIGVFYKEDKPTYEDGLPQLQKGPLTKRDISNIDLSTMLAKYK